MAQPLRTLIVDDEPVARRVLREELEASCPDLEVIGEAENGHEALDRIAAWHPDLVFLDLQMPGLGGFDVVRSLPAPQAPVVVIVTAFDQHAMEAFEAGAVDYLLKPVSQERLLKSVERARLLHANAQQRKESLARLQEVADGGPSGRARRIVGRVGEEYHLLSPDEVLAFQAEGEEVWIVTRQRRLLATQPLKTLQERLDGTQFQRVHRNALVNVNHVRKMSALSSQRWLITLSNQQELIVSKRQARYVRELLS